MDAKKMNDALAALAAKALEDGADLVALAQVTTDAATEWDALAVTAEAKANALTNALTANAPVIAGACLVRGAQADIARGIAPKHANGETHPKDQNTASKKVGRIASVGRLMVAHPKADVLALYTFVNGATKQEIDAACESKADPTKAPARKRGASQKKKTAGPRKVADLVTALSNTTKAVTDSVIEHGVKKDQENMAAMLRANLKRVEAALASGVHGSGVIPAEGEQGEQGEQENAA